MHLRTRIATLNQITARPRRSPSRAAVMASKAKRLAGLLMHRAWDDDCADRDRELLEAAAVVLRAQARVIETTRARR
jgi:hypothetical protein